MSQFVRTHCIEPQRGTSKRFCSGITERGNWLSVRVADTPEYELETQRERSSMNSVEWFNDQITWAAGEKPESTKGSKNRVLDKACNLLCESLHHFSSF